MTNKLLLLAKKMGLKSPKTAQEAAALVDNPHIIFSVDNPYHKIDGKKLSIEDAVAKLKEMGEDAQIVRGKYGSDEISILVANPRNSDEIYKLAKSQGQDSIFQKAGDTNYLVQLHDNPKTGAKAGQVYVGKGSQHGQEFEDMYTSIPLGVGQEYKFQHALDFSKPKQGVKHYAPKHISEVDPELAGTGADAQKAFRYGKDKNKTAQLYNILDQREGMIQGQRHIGALDPDVIKQVDGIDHARAMQEVQLGMYGRLDDAYKAQLKEKGVTAFQRPLGGDQNVIESFQKVPVNVAGVGAAMGAGRPQQAVGDGFQISPQQWQESVLANVRPDYNMAQDGAFNYNSLPPEINEAAAIQSAEDLAMSMGPGAIEKVAGKLGKVLFKETAQEAAESRATQMLDKRPKVQLTPQEIIEAVQMQKMKKPQGMYAGGEVKGYFNGGMPDELAMQPNIDEFPMQAAPMQQPLLPALGTTPSLFANEAPSPLVQQPPPAPQVPISNVEPMAAAMPNPYQQMGATQAAGFNEQAKLYEQAAARQQALMQEREAKLAEINAEREAIIQDINDQEIDPDRYFNRMGAGQKITSAIGLLLGGLGQGMMGRGDNPVQTYIQNQLNNDLKAQQMELGKKENLLSANLRHFGNMEDALKMTQVMQNDYLSHQIGQSAAKMNSNMAKQQAAMLTQQLQQRNQMLLQEMKLSGDAPSQNIDKDFAKSQLMLKLAGQDKKAAEQASLFVPGLGMALDKEDAKKMKELSGTVKAATTGINDLLKIQGKPFKSLSFDERARANTIRTSLVGLLRVPLTGPGAMSDGERELLQSIIRDPTRITSLDSSNKASLEALQQRMASILESEADARGIRIQGRKQQAASQIPFKPLKK